MTSKYYRTAYYPQPPAAPKLWQQTQHLFVQVGRSLLEVLIGSREPQIISSQSRDQQTTFQVYDPVRSTHHFFESEHEVRVWLEQRYYR